MKKERLVVLFGAICLILVLVMGLSPLLAVSAERPKSVSLASAGEGTSQFAVHAGMTTLITKYVGIKAVPEASSVGGKTLHLLHNKEVELASSTNHAAHDAARGLGQFKKSGKLNFRLLSGGMIFSFVMTTRADSDVRSMMDLKGKKVQATHPGNITFTKAADFFLEAEAMSRANIKSLEFFGSRTIAPALKEKRTVASITGVSTRAVPGWMQKLNLEVPMYLFAPAKEKIESLLPRYPYFLMNPISARVYGKMIENKDLPTIGTGMSLYCRTDLSEDLVYEMMRAIFDHKDELHTFHKSAVQWTKDLLRKPVAPYHPGAVKYYKEKGLWTAETDKAQRQLLAELTP